MGRDGGLYKEYLKYLPDFHWQRVEVGQLNRGVPDVNYCYNGVEGWVENKGTEDGRFKFRPEQRGWIIDRSRHGGIVYVAVRMKTMATDTLLLYDGESLARATESMNINRLTSHMIEVYFGGPTHWNWQKITSLLISNRSSYQRESDYE